MFEGNLFRNPEVKHAVEKFALKKNRKQEQQKTNYHMIKIRRVRK